MDTTFGLFIEQMIYGSKIYTFYIFSIIHVGGSGTYLVKFYSC